MNPKFAFIRRLHVSFAALVTGGAALFLASCASYDSSGNTTASGGLTYRRTGGYAPTAPAAEGGVGSTPQPAPQALASRPGLGTSLGWKYEDRSSATTFYRRRTATPDGVGSFYYNDKEGAKAMADLAGSPSKHSGSFKLADGKVRVALQRYGSKFDWYESGGRVFVIGEAGSRYSIAVENPGKERIEVVVSVDGLDVLSGESASMSRRGYVVPAHGTINIDGLRIGKSIHQFEFGSVRDSQAAKTGGERGARNVGVIGVAVYVEDEAAARLARVQEGFIRDGARAFPGS